MEIKVMLLVMCKTVQEEMRGTSSIWKSTKERKGQNMDRNQKMKRLKKWVDL
jgi:hypothetical protein